MIPGRVSRMSLVLLLSSSAFAGSVDGYDAKILESVLKGRKIVVAAGCPEEPRLNEGITNVFEKNFGGVPEDDSAFRAKVTSAFLAGLAKTGGSRLEFDSTACRMGASSKVVEDVDGHSAMIDGRRASAGKAYLALGFFHYESPEEWEKFLDRPGKLVPGPGLQKVGARLSFGIYDPQERLLVYHNTARTTASDDIPLLKVRLLGPEHWEESARRLGEKIGKVLAKLPGK